MTDSAGPLVSIVLATNRNSQFLDATLKSVCDQTWDRWELIIVDDGGPDPSMLEEIARPIPNCVVIHRPHGGLSMARNAGVAASRGEFLVFLDDDDIWHPDRLRRQIDEFRRDPDAVACYSSGWHIDEFGAELPYGWPPTGATREQLLSGAIGIPKVVTMMVRREPCITVGCFNTAICLAEDSEWILRLLRYGRFVCSPDALVGYRHHGNNVTKAPYGKRLEWSRRAVLLQLWAAEAQENPDDLWLMRQNMQALRRRHAEYYLDNAVAKAAAVTATRLTRFVRTRGAARKP